MDLTIADEEMVQVVDVIPVSGLASFGPAAVRKYQEQVRFAEFFFCLLSSRLLSI